MKLRCAKARSWFPSSVLSVAVKSRVCSHGILRQGVARFERISFLQRSPSNLAVRKIATDRCRSTQPELDAIERI
jgi:hypothetical protein